MPGSRIIMAVAVAKIFSNAEIMAAIRSPIWKKIFFLSGVVGDYQMGVKFPCDARHFREVQCSANIVYDICAARECTLCRSRVICVHRNADFAAGHSVSRMCLIRSHSVAGSMLGVLGFVDSPPMLTIAVPSSMSFFKYSSSPAPIKSFLLSLSENFPY